jgi:hypothetical protein
MGIIISYPALSFLAPSKSREKIHHGVYAVIASDQVLAMPAVAQPPTHTSALHTPTNRISGGILRQQGVSRCNYVSIIGSITE